MQISRAAFAARILALPLAVPAPMMSQAAPGAVLMQAGTHAVVVNVVVKDKHGKPVGDLKRDDFVLRDNNVEQKIGFFAWEQADTAPPVTASRGSLTFSNRPGPAVAAQTVFLFDELNTQLTDQQLAKQDFVRYLRGLTPSSHVAVFVLGDSLALLHDSTQDMQSLPAALNKHTNRVNPEIQAAAAPPASSNSLTGNATTTAQWDGFLQSSERSYVNYTQIVRATRTAAALATIAGHLQGTPGRKTLIWISGGFPIQLGLRDSVNAGSKSNNSARGPGRPAGQSRQAGGSRGGTTAGNDGNKTTANSPANTASTAAPADIPGTGTSFESDVARAIRALNEADVAVYPVDARGLNAAAAFQADRSSLGKRNKPMKASDGPDFNYETLETLAEQTGGVAFHHINDLSAAIHEAASDGRVSYSLTFSPPSESFDGSYHRLEVAVKRPDVKVRYRPGYVATRDTAMTPSLAEAIANPVAMGGIGFTVQLDPVEGGYKASLTIDAHNLTLQPKDSGWTGSLEFLVVVGEVEQLTTIPLNLTEALYRQIEEKGLHLGARVKTTPGTTGFSLGLRDIPSGLVGTLHVTL